MMINDYNIRLVLGRNSFGLLSQMDDPWIRYSFDILLDEEDGSGQIVGSMQASKLSYGEMSRRGVPLWMAFDDFSMETSECYCVLFTKKGNLRKTFWHPYYGLEEYFARDFHFLERIEINENFKGNDIAGIATQIYLENFAGLMISLIIANLRVTSRRVKRSFVNITSILAFAGLARRNISFLSSITFCLRGWS